MKRIDLPDEIVRFYGLSDEVLNLRALFLMVFDLLRQKKLTSGKAAELLGVGRHEILDLMGEYGIAAVNYSPEDLEKEIGVWEKIKSGAA